MGLHSKGPYVDRFAKNSVESVIALRSIFYERNGFVARPDDPDYGCDFMIEIIEADVAKNWRFPMQLKSVEKPKLVDENRFISYNFELSRLGYLLEHKPEIGMVVLYSIPDKKLYYDYADKIYYRLKDLHSDYAWEDQDTANIRIPVRNVLDLESVRVIYQYAATIFRNFREMYSEIAPDYNLPSIHTPVVKEKNPSLEESAVQGLKDFGLEFLQQGDLKILLEMIGVLPTGVITFDAKLSIIAGMTFHEAGMHIDAEYFLEKGLYNQDIDNELRMNAQWTKLKNEYMRNKIDRSTFTRELQSMRGVLGTNEHNLILVDLNLAFHQVMGNHVLDDIPTNFESSFEDLSKRIDAIEVPVKQKHFLHLMNLTNLSIFTQRVSEINLFTIESYFDDVRRLSLNMRLKLVNEFVRLNDKIRKGCIKIYKEAYAIGDLFIQAEALSVLANNSLMIHIASFKRRHTHLQNITDERTDIEQIVNYHLTACNAYFKVNYFDRAYRQICCALEWIYIAEYKKIVVSFDKVLLEGHMKEMQKDFQFPPYEFQSLQIINEFGDSPAPESIN